MKRERLIVVLGPTASGKTGLSIELAKQFDTEIISGDSQLVYKGFDIGSAKPDMKERDGVVHHMIDILPPDASFNVADFIDRVKPIITDLNNRGKLPILAGGTGLYIKSLLEGYQFNDTAGDDEYRLKLEKLAEDGVKITSLSFVDGRVSIAVDVETESGSELTGPLAPSVTPKSSGLEVTAKVYWKQSLADSQWTLVTEKTFSVGSGETEIDAGDAISGTSGFYKVIVEEKK